MPGISYDDSGSLANYFGVTFLACALIPYTYAVFKPAKKDPLKPQCTCSKCTAHLRDVQSQAASTRRRKFSRRIIPLLLGWLAFGYMAHRISVAPQLPGAKVYNPFEILGISSSLDEKAIKKHYKRLSLQYHPDKITLGPNETMEQVEDKFVELTKAYKSLTDDVIRENLAKYGNPDGPQQREDKIAIPQWVVEGKNSIWVLVAYGLLLGGGIPWIVGCWWFRQRRTTRDNVLNGSAEYFFHSLRDDTDFVTLITIFSGAKEFAHLLDPKASSHGRMAKKARKELYSQVEELEKHLDARRADLGIDESATLKKDSRVSVGSAGQRKARALLWAHLLRYDMNGDKALMAEQRKLLDLAPPLLQSMANISQAHGWLKTSLLCLRLQAALAQAVPLGFTPVAQLPGVELEEAERVAVEGGYEGDKWLDRLILDKQGEKAGVNQLEKGEKEDKMQLSQEAREVAKGWYKLDVVSAEFKVEGETVVPPSSIVNLVIKVRYAHPGSTPAPTAQNLPNGDSHPENGDSTKDAEVEGEKGAVEKVREKTLELVSSVDEVEGKGQEKEKVWAKNGYAHAPYWPTLRKPHYHVLLGDSKLDKVIVPPIRITDIPTPSSSTGSVETETREFKLTFPAPPQPNLYSFILHLVSDTCLGTDVALPVMMKVEEPPQITEINGADVEGDDEDDDGISDPEEDSLAGQMALMKGGRVKRSPVRNEYESSEEEGSDTDGEGESGSEEEEEEGEEGGRRLRGREGKAINEDTDSEEE